MSVRIALLVCGALTGSVYAKHGDYHAVFHRFLAAALPDPAVTFALDPFDVIDGHYPDDAQLNSYDALLLTGSASSAYEPVQWITTLIAYIRRIASDKPNLKLIGICFGHQIISLALGGQCVPNGGRWEVGPTPLDLTPIGRTLFSTDTKLTIQQMHRDHVPSVLPGFELLASSEVSPNQGMVRFAPNSTPSLRSVQILTLQGHPEFTEPIVSGLIDQRTQSGVIDEQAAEDAERRRFWKTDGVDVVGKAVWGVLGVEPKAE